MNDTQYRNTTQKQVAETAKAMIDGRMHYLEGAIKLEALRHKVGAYENDPSFSVWTAILSEIDQLQIGRDPKKWTKALLKKKEIEIGKSIQWAKEISLVHCEELVRRYQP